MRSCVFSCLCIYAAVPPACDACAMCLSCSCFVGSSLLAYSSFDCFFPQFASYFYSHHSAGCSLRKRKQVCVPMASNLQRLKLCLHEITKTKSHNSEEKKVQNWRKTLLVGVKRLTITNLLQSMMCWFQFWLTPINFVWNVVKYNKKVAGLEKVGWLQYCLLKKCSHDMVGGAKSQSNLSQQRKRTVSDF